MIFDNFAKMIISKTFLSSILTLTSSKNFLFSNSFFEFFFRKFRIDFSFKNTIQINNALAHTIKKTQNLLK